MADGTEDSPTGEPAEHTEIQLLREIAGRLEALAQSSDAAVAALESVNAGLEALNATTTELATTVAAFFAAWQQADTTPPQMATTGRVTVVASPPQAQGEPPMALTVDAAGVAKFQFEDDKGDLNVSPPAGDGTGITVAFSSDNPAVVSGYSAAVEGQDANGNPEWTATPTVVADGTFNLSAAIGNTSGAALVDDDGATPFKQPDPVAVTLAGGQASTGTVSES